jgi:Ca2+-binding EF-hand superfamily protein
LKEIDENGDGEIDFEEFKLMMKKCNQSWTLNNESK